VVQLPTQTLVFGRNPGEEYILTPAENDTLMDSTGVIYADLQSFMKHKKFHNFPYVQYICATPKSVIHFMDGQFTVSEVQINGRSLVVVSKGFKNWVNLYWTGHTQIWTEDGQQAGSFTPDEYETFVKKFLLPLNGSVMPHLSYIKV
jgi:hypothetical protein